MNAELQDDYNCPDAIRSYPVTLKIASDENVNHPSHYKGKGLECIQVIEAFDLGFNLGNSIKYILRAGKKGNRKQDLQKAIWYLQRESELPEK